MHRDSALRCVLQSFSNAPAGIIVFENIRFEKNLQSRIPDCLFQLGKILGSVMQQRDPVARKKTHHCTTKLSWEICRGMGVGAGSFFKPASWLRKARRGLRFWTTA